MKNKILTIIAIGCCAVFFCAASAFGQSYDTCAAMKMWKNNIIGNTPTTITLTGTSNTQLPNTSYSPTTGSSDPTCATTEFTFSGISCGYGFNELIKGKGSSVLSLEINTTIDSSDCANIVWATYYLAGGNDYQKMYDSSRSVIEHCAQFSHFPPLKIWNFFGEATAGAQYMSNDNNRWPSYRDWLKKVLYYNLDTSYYCSDVEAILSSMQYFNAERGYDRNGALAIVKFLRDSNRCLSWLGDVNTLWTQTRNDQYQTWRDTSHAGHINPLDTTLPSLEDLDLQILRGPQYAAVKNAFTPTSMSKITSFSVSENPFKEETKLIFGLADGEYMKIEIYDVLGNKVYSDSKLFGAGNEEWIIPGVTLPQGVLYARLLTMGGEVQTVKLVHEK